MKNLCIKLKFNVKKTEMVIFKSKQKNFESDLKIKLCGKILYPTESVKYLCVTTKPQVLHRVTLWNFSIRQIDMGSIQ